MAQQSELAKKITKAIKAADKLVRDITKDTEKLREAVRDLREIGKREE